MGYTFGDGDVAKARLRILSDFFNPLSEEFIEDNLNMKVKIAVDLGCGPGYTTSMLAKCTQAKKTYGFDISDSFLDEAKKEFPKYTFVNHNVTVFPFPVKANILYCRFLLSHLNNIREIIKQWLNQLRKGGTIFIDELEDIHTEMEAFQEYLSINERLIKSQGANLFVGKILDSELSEFNIIYNKSSIMPVLNWLAAGWFYPNTISIWETDKWAKKNIKESERMRISSGLIHLYSKKDDLSDINWRMRRIIITKK